MQFTKFKLLWIFFLIFFNPTYSFSNSVQNDNGKNFFISGEVNSKKSLDVKNQNLKRNNTLVNVKTGNDLNLLVDEIIKGINKPESLTKFKELKKLVSAVFNSNPIFLQTLESMKLSKAKKDEVFASFLPQVRSSIGGGIKSGGLNNDSSSKNLNLTVKQLVFDFKSTKNKFNSVDAEEQATYYATQTKKKELLIKIIESIHYLYGDYVKLQLTQGYVATRRDFLNSIKAKEKIGGSSNADVLRAEAKLSEALDQIPGVTKKYKQSKSTYFEYFQSEPKNVSLFQLPKVENRKFNINADVLENLDVLQELNQKIKAAEFSYKSDKSTRYGSFDLQAGYQNSDTNLLSPQEQSSLMLAYNIDIFTGFQRSSQIAQSLSKLNSLKLEKERVLLALRTQLDQSLIDYESQSAQVLSRIDLVKGAKITIKINEELFDLNRMSINELFRSQEEYIVAARNLIDAVVEKNISFYRLIANFNQLLNLFGQTV